MKHKLILPIRLNFFDGGDPPPTPPATPPGTVYTDTQLEEIIKKRVESASDGVLKDYFKKQGLVEEELAKAIADYKVKQANQTPDITVLQQQITTAQQAKESAEKAILQEKVSNAAILEAVALGVDAKVLQHVIKLADFSKALKDGAVDTEAVKTAISKVLEDVPAFKVSAPKSPPGFQIGAGVRNGNVENSPTTLSAAIAAHYNKKG